MTRDLAAVATLDDRRRCPISAASNVVDDASSMITNSIVTSSSSSNGDLVGGDEGSPKSSSAMSTTTSCCSGSDDDDSATVPMPSTVIEDSCPTTMKTPLHKEIDNNIGDTNYSNNSNDITVDTSTNIGGRLTFYKDGKFIFQLAAHHQKHSYDQSAITSPCRWVPVPTVLQQNKNSVISIGEWSQQNKTIWPYLVTNHTNDKMPQSIQQSQPVIVNERKKQNFIASNKSVGTPIGSVVVTTTNIVRKPSRKCSTVTSEYDTCGQSQSQLRPVSKRLQQHQHQSFMMVATETIKAQRRLLSIQNNKHYHSRKTKTLIGEESMLLKEPRAPINLECVVRHLWCRQHTKELLLRRNLLLNNSVDVTNSSASKHFANNVDFTLSNSGSGKRRSMFSLSNSNSTDILPATTITMATSSLSINGGNNCSSSNNNKSPHKKYKLGQHQQGRPTSDNDTKKNILPPTNNHSITAILSGSSPGTKRFCTPVVEPKGSTTSNTDIVTPQKSHLPLSSAPISLLRTLLKSPVSESGVQQIVVSTNDGGYRFHNNSGSRKRLAIESTIGSPIPPSSTLIGCDVVNTTVANNSAMTSAIMIQPQSTVTVNDNSVNETTSTSALTAINQLPTLHNSATAAAGQLTAAGYFNVLYHQAAMAAAMAYQSHTQSPKSVLPSQFPTRIASSSGWLDQINRQPLIHSPESVNATTGVAAFSSASPIVAPYSSSLITTAVNNIGLLPPATSSSPPPVYLHHMLLNRQQHHQKQQYQPISTIQQPFSYHQQKQLLHSNITKRKMEMTVGMAECDTVDGNNLSIDQESSASSDCMPLNLSKNSDAKNINDTSTTATVR